MPTRVGWPKPGTAARMRLEDLYWGDEPLGRSFETPPLKGGYYLPRMLNSTGQGLATWRSSGDVLSDRMTQFVHWWEQWRRRGGSVEARLRARRPVKVPANGSALPMPTPIARWEDRRSRRGVLHGADRDHRNPRPR